VSDASRTLADALRADPWLTGAVRESRAFALDLASALFGISFVRVTRQGAVSKGVPPWRWPAPIEWSGVIFSG
jgi:hypothetical protein